jgi:hypothetical protein
MISKLPEEKKSQKNCQFMFQIYAPNQKVQGRVTMLTFLKLFLNAMMRNIKIHNISDIIRTSKSMELDKYIH